jgi:uncharacterized protein
VSQVPVDAGTAIRQTLLALEGKQSVKVLYAVESGSRAWGFASADSDYDVRFIYHRPVEAYLRLERPRDVIELPISEGIDVSGWDIFKAAALLRKSNPPLIEWLGSPIVYQEDSSVTAVLREQCARHFSRRACGEHYLSMARNNYQDSILGQSQVRKKKYLYALRPLLCLQWLLERGTFPPTMFMEVRAGLDLPAPLGKQIDDLIAAKLAEPETATVKPIEIFDSFIEQRLEQMPAVLAGVPDRPFPPEALDRLIRGLLLETPATMQF